MCLEEKMCSQRWIVIGEKVNPRKRCSLRRRWAREKMCSLRRRWAREKMCSQGKDGIEKRMWPRGEDGLGKGSLRRIGGGGKDVV
jgi:hypothetical protein